MANENANVNVRFYRLNKLPSFVVEKHKGIFVHVTGIMNKAGGKELWMEPIKDGGNVGRIDLEQWLEKRRIDSIESGLWFGGENGWELLSNDTTSGAIDAAIDAKIQGLDVGGYAQATISGSTLTISGIKEVDGKIAIDNDQKLEVAIDGTYNESTNKIATQSTVTTAINGLNAETVQAVTFNTPENGGNTTLTFKGVKEVNGVIAQGTGADTFIVGDAKLNIQIGSTTIENVFSANAQSDGAIKLNENVFTKDENNVISVITKNNDVSSTNPLVTQNDINGLAGAMHYRGGVTSVPTADNSTKKGDVWIVTTAFVTASESYEVGDMFIARADGANATFDTVQGNLTLGINPGQIAKNDITLTAGNIVVATGTGIKTIGISETQLTDINENHRHLSIGSDGPADGNFHHNVTIRDGLKVIGKDLAYSINISSPNRSINIINNNDTTANIGVMVDLVWNTTMER